MPFAMPSPSSVTHLLRLLSIAACLCAAPGWLRAADDNLAAQAQARRQDAESLLQLSAEGRALYARDTIRLDGYGYCGQALALAERGELRQSIRAASKALYLGQEGSDEDLQANAQRDLAIAYGYAGVLDLAERHAREALALPVHDESQVHAPAHKVLGDVAARRGRFDEAQAAYQRALDLASPRYRPFVQLSMANAQTAGGQAGAALQTLQALPPAGRGPLGPYYERSLAQALLATGQVDAALQQWRRVIDAGAAGEPAPARRATSATSAGGAADLADLNYHRLWAWEGSARAELTRGRPAEALAAYQQALRLADPLRARFRSEEFKSGLFSDLQAVFEAALNLAVQQGDWAGAWRISEASRARALLDAVRQHADDRLARPVPLGQLQGRLAADEAVLEFHVLPQQTLAWLIRRDGLVGLALPLPQAALQAGVEKLRASIIARRPDTVALAQALHRQLLGPLDLTGLARLQVVPHGALHYLPFQVLHDGRGYLVERLALASWPSAALGAQLGARRAGVAGGLALQAFGNPSTDRNVPLPGAEQEVQEIRPLFAQGRTFLQQQASRAQLLAALGGAGGPATTAGASSVLHVAAHAEVDEIDPMYSRILLASSPLDDGLLEAREIYRLDLSRTPLVTLSACDSALGRIARGDEILGFTRSFLSAGASTVIASLWPVADDATRQLMTRFYRDATQGADAMQALRNAQLEVMRGRGQAHPFFWAPFNVIGDGALRLGAAP